MTVAPIVPSATLRTPEQLPSIEVTRTVALGPPDREEGALRRRLR